MSENEASLVEEGAGRVDAAGETPIPTGTLSIQPADDTPDPTQNEISRQLQQAIGEFGRLPTNVKFLLPFILVLVVKFLVDHLFAGILLLLLIAALDYNKQKIKMQLALKTHLNKMALWALLLFVSASISLCYLIYPYMGYTENIIQRLLIIYAVNSSETQSIWAVLWNCCLTDIVAQMLVVLCKTLICLVTAHNNMAALRTLGSSIRSKSHLS
ncbi:hypothetical protein EON65_44955 [archaeon]|nr:MAG: hypothetical protein EON65_44955 [archaeon]